MMMIQPYQLPQGGVMIDDVYAPTILPSPTSFKPAIDAERLRQAMKGLGTNETELIQVLCRRPWSERSEIDKTYKQMFNRDLKFDITDETSGNFSKVLERLLKSPIELAAFDLHKAMQGAGTDEDALCDIICTKQSDELKAISTVYKELYDVKLEDSISDETSGFFRRLLLSLLTGNRPKNGPVDANAAAADAKALYEAGEKQVGTDENRFNTILCERSYSHLRAVFDCYFRQYKKDIHDVIMSEFSGDVAQALATVVAAIRNRPGYFAMRLNKAMYGAGTNEDMLLRIICSRADIDLAAVKQEYQRMYGKILSSVVKSETSGDLKAALVAMLD